MSDTKISARDFSCLGSPKARSTDLHKHSLFERWHQGTEERREWNREWRKVNKRCVIELLITVGNWNSISLRTLWGTSQNYIVATTLEQSSKDEKLEHLSTDLHSPLLEDSTEGVLTLSYFLHSSWFFYDFKISSVSWGDTQSAGEHILHVGTSGSIPFAAWSPEYETALPTRIKLRVDPEQWWV